MRQVLASVALAMLCGVVLAKLPPPDDAAKAKTAEAAAKNAWQAKVDGYLLCKAQDRVAAAYARTAGKAAGKEAPPAAAAAQPPVAAASAAASAASAARPTGTPIAFAPPPPCMDPGPFATNAPAEKPLETSGAHSPAGNAASPPSVKQDSATMAPAKKP
jgi:hypothetical protein